MLKPVSMFAQSKDIPLHFEASLLSGTPSKGLMPFGANIDLNYTFVKNLALHAVVETSYFIPKEGVTSKYNKANNLGGGLSYTLFPQINDNLGDFELRASVTTSVGSSDFKNTAFNVGVNWHSHTDYHKLVPVIGVGYAFKDFSAKGMSNYNGAYLTVGVRF